MPRLGQRRLTGKATRARLARRRGAKAGLVFVAAGVAVSAMAASVTAAPAVTRSATPLNYVALGSSFASGFGQTPYAPTTIGAYCGRSLDDYPQQVAAALGLSLTDATCGGATTANILSTPQYGFIPPQIDAVTSATQLVTITAGGNDVNYLLGLDSTSCADDPSVVPVTYQPDVCVPVDPTATQAALAQVEQNLVAVVQAVKARAPQARVVFVDYVDILPLFNQGCAATPLTAQQMSYSRGIAAKLAVATAQAAVATRSEDIPMSLLTLGHDVCSSDPWVNPWVASVSVGAWYHPNAEGIAFESKVITSYFRFTGLS